MTLHAPPSILSLALCAALLAGLLPDCQARRRLRDGNAGERLRGRLPERVQRPPTPLLLPEPDTPVTQVNRPTGNSTLRRP